MKIQIKRSKKYKKEVNEKIACVGLNPRHAKETKLQSIPEQKNTQCQYYQKWNRIILKITKVSRSQ